MAAQMQKARRISIFVEDADLAKLQVFARKDALSVSYLIRKAVKEYLSRRGGADGEDPDKR